MESTITKPDVRKLEEAKKPQPVGGVSKTKPNIPTTGIAQLDQQIDYLTWGGQVAILAITEMKLQDSALASRVLERIRANIKHLLNREIVAKEFADKGLPEEAVEITWWIAFREGLNYRNK